LDGAALEVDELAHGDEDLGQHLVEIEVGAERSGDACQQRLRVEDARQTGFCVVLSGPHWPP
jgi:hypothetical protein